jgi:hypothetical protein
VVSSIKFERAINLPIAQPQEPTIPHPGARADEEIETQRFDRTMSGVEGKAENICSG